MRRDQLEYISRARLEQGSGDGGDPTDLALEAIGFVNAQNSDGSLITVFFDIRDGSAKEDLLFAMVGTGVCDFGQFQTLA